MKKMRRGMKILLLFHCSLKFFYYLCSAIERHRLQGRSAHKAEGECTPSHPFLLLKNFNNLLNNFFIIFLSKKFAE